MAVVREQPAVAPVQSWQSWPVYWSAVWVGALAALVMALLIGLIGIAVGAQAVGPGHALVKWGDFTVAALVFSVAGAFFSFVVGGWAAGRVAGLLQAEPAMLHGAVVWLLAVPLLVAFAALGAGSFFGGWYGGLAGTPSWITPPAAAADPNAAVIARNEALGALTALLLGLVGAVLGGWVASGEPMTFTHHRTRALGRADGRAGSATRP